MILASEANRLTNETLKEKENGERKMLLVNVEENIREVCDMGLNSVAVFTEEKHQAFLKDALTALGYKILPNDPELSDAHILITWA